MDFLLLLIFALFVTILSSWLFIRFFQKPDNAINSKMFKIVGNSAIAQTEISETFGIASFKDDFGCEKNIVCYSYREKINKNFRVLITDYDIYRQMYIVDEYPK